jgi:sialidase-1
VDAGICYKNSSDDGATWSRIWLVRVGATQPTVVCAGKSLILQYSIGTTNEQITSQDSGATWSVPTSVVLGKYGWASVGPGRGIQLSDKSPAPGRLLFIGHHGAYEYDLVWYSDDGGETYILSETVLEKMDEAQLVELSDGRVMPNMRNDHLTSCDCRAVAISTDGGKTFGDISYDPALISPVCMASIIRMSNGSLIFANPASKKDRVNGMLKRSDDEGVSWVMSWQVTV